MEEEFTLSSEEKEPFATNSGRKTGLQNVQDTVADKLHTIAEEVSERTQSPNMPSVVGSYGREVSEFLDQGAGYVRDLDYDELRGEVQDYVKQNPGFSLLMAGAVGFVIGVMVRRM